MKNIKIYLFIEILALFVTMIFHVTYVLIGLPFNVIMYPIMIGVIACVCLLVEFVVIPFGEKFLED